MATEPHNRDSYTLTGMAAQAQAGIPRHYRLLSSPIREWGPLGPFCWALRVLGIGSAVTVGADNFEFPACATADRPACATADRPACATADRSVAEPQKQIPIIYGIDG